MKKETFVKGMAIFLATFLNIKTTEKTQDVWFEFLKNLTDKEFEFAIGNICNNVTEFYPTTNFVALVKEQLKTNIENKSMLAWEKAKFAIVKHGYYDSVKFDDKVIHSAIELMGGWLELYGLYFNESKLEWVRKDFCRCYEAMSEKKVHPEYLVGHIEKDNKYRAYDEFIQPPVLIFQDNKGIPQSKEQELLENKDVKLLK